MGALYTIPRDIWYRMTDKQRDATFDRLCWRGPGGLIVMQREGRWSYWRRLLREKVCRP